MRSNEKSNEGKEMGNKTWQWAVGRAAMMAPCGGGDGPGAAIVVGERTRR